MRNAVRWYVAILKPWRKFFRIKNNDLFWINRDKWPKKPELVTCYVEASWAWYESTCGPDFYSSETLAANVATGFADEAAFENVVSDFLAQYGSLEIERAEPFIGQGGTAVILTTRSTECSDELIPVYFRGAIVK